jgi:hypothetical protein
MDHVLVYCELISLQFVGSKYARVIRTFTIPTAYCTNIFDNVYYMPVEKRRFHDIAIKILKSEGTPVNFSESEVPVKVVIHFRCVSHW